MGWIGWLLICALLLMGVVHASGLSSAIVIGRRREGDLRDCNFRAGPCPQRCLMRPGKTRRFPKALVQTKQSKNSLLCETDHASILRTSRVLLVGLPNQRGGMMRRPRCRVRTLMLLVAAVAIPLAAGVQFHRRWRGFKDRAVYHRQEISRLGLSELEVYLVYTAASPEARSNILQAPKRPTPDPPAEYQSALAHESRLLRDFIRYHEGLVIKYEFALNHPWLSVAPDAPAPATVRVEELTELGNSFGIGEPAPPGVRTTPAYDGWHSDVTAETIALAYGTNLVERLAEVARVARWVRIVLTTGITSTALTEPAGPAQRP